MSFTLYLKLMSGDIIPFDYFNYVYAYSYENCSISKSIEKFFKTKYDIGKGYNIFITKDGENISESTELKNEDILDVILIPKDFNVIIILLDNSLMYKHVNDLEAWKRGEFYKKYKITLKDKDKKVEEYIFYNRKNLYIPFSSIQLINAGRYDDEDHIILIDKNPVFYSMKDMIYFFMKNNYEESMCNDVYEKIAWSWN